MLRWNDVKIEVSDVNRTDLVASTVSVVIPARNAASSIKATLGSLSNDRNLLYEILVVDDGSTDRTGAVARETALKLCLPVTVIPVTVNDAGAARNVGIRLAGGELLFLMDADDTLLDGGLRRLTNRLGADPKIDVAVGGYVRRLAGVVDKVRLPRPYLDDPNRNAHDYLTNRLRSIAMGSALIRRHAVGDSIFPEAVSFDEDTIFWASILSRSNVATVSYPTMIYNVDATRMESRFTTAPFEGFAQISKALDKLARFGIGAETLRWRKGWLARRIARALIRREEFGQASEFLRLAAAQHPRIKFGRSTLWYWANVHAGSILQRLR